MSRDGFKTSDYVEQLMTQKPGMSVREIARAATNEGRPIAWEDIQRARVKYLQKLYDMREVREAVQAATPSVIADKTPWCVRCGGQHWASVCDAQLESVGPVPIPLVNIKESSMEENTSAPTPEPTPVPPPIVAPPPIISARKKMATANMMIRRQYLNELLDKDPGADPRKMVLAVKEKFGIGLDIHYVYATCRVAREVHNLPRIPEREDPNGREFVKREPLPTYGGATDDDEEEYANNPDDECLWLAKQAGDVMRAHGLTELRLTVEGGKAHWSYTVMRTGKGEVDL